MRKLIVPIFIASILAGCATRPSPEILAKLKQIRENSPLPPRPMAVDPKVISTALIDSAPKALAGTMCPDPVPGEVKLCIGPDPANPARNMVISGVHNSTNEWIIQARTFAFNDEWFTIPSYYNHGGTVWATNQYGPSSNGKPARKQLYFRAKRVN